MDDQTTADLTVDELSAAWPILAPEERLEAFTQFDAETGQEFFHRLDADDQAELLLALPQERRRHLLAILPPDDLADVFQELDQRSQRLVFKSLSPEDLAEVQELAAYDWDDAGGIMTPDFAHVLPDMTVDRCIISLRLQLKENPETLRYVYVLYKDGRLAGIVSLRELFAAPAEALVRDIMKTDVETVLEETDQEEVAQRMGDLGITAIPVVDSGGVMKGIITADDMIAVMEEEATEDIQKLAGVAPTERDYVRASVGLLWSRRVGWLLVLLFAGVLTSLIMARFEETLRASVVLAFYVPLLMGAAGNTGTQSAMLVIRSLATGELRPRDWSRVFVKEIAVGVLLALLLSVTLGVLGYYSAHGGAEVALVLSITMATVVLWANLIGAILPVAIRAVKLDPAVVSAPLVTTLVDISGIIIYLSIAEAVLG